MVGFALEFSFLFRKAMDFIMQIPSKAKYYNGLEYVFEICDVYLNLYEANALHIVINCSYRFKTGLAAK